ncbi:MAG: hypothetical protein ACI9Y1_003023 [Lentisphaeria bacterium]|jgi:hypothetical protein
MWAVIEAKDLMRLGLKTETHVYRIFLSAWFLALLVFLVPLVLINSTEERVRLS